MYSLNRATLIGNLTRDPELKQIPSGQSVCSFSIATDRQWTGGDGQKQKASDFHNIVAWGKLAEICSQYLVKGKKVYIEGRIQTRDWDGQDGVKRYRTEIVAENMIMLDRSAGGPVAGTSAPTFPSPSRGFVPPQAPIRQDEPSANPDDEIRVEDIPF